MTSDIYEQVILRKANQHVQARLNVAVPSLDSTKSHESLVKRQRSMIKEMASQAVTRAKREEAEDRVKAEGRPPTDEDFRLHATEAEIREAAIAIAEAVATASQCQHFIDQQILEGLKRGL